MVSLPVHAFSLDATSDVPIYRQIAHRIATLIETGQMSGGERLPATRELAGQLGLNRATISAAYGFLEESGFISGHVGRGSFVAQRLPGPREDGLVAPRPVINFASSRPATQAFPLASFRRLSKAVIDGPEAAEILQLGSPHGYAPLRRYLLEQDHKTGIARAGDDVLITNGCQQALDLLARAFVSNPHQPDASAVLVEDPVYHGLLRIFGRAGARILPVPVGPNGLDIDAAEELIERHRPRMLVITPDFQNPTGWSIPARLRKRLVNVAHRTGVLLVENGIYSRLRYSGEVAPPLKQFDESGRSVLLRSYSKVLFPGLRVGWVTGPRDIIRRLSEEKQIADLHSDQLAQAIFLRFAQSGELDEHIARTCAVGRKRLEAAFSACSRFWPQGTSWTKPEGGMSLWVELPAPLTAGGLLRRVQRDGVEFLQGSNFSLQDRHSRGLRISFGGLSPDLIERGIQLLGAAASAELAATEDNWSFEAEAALV